MGLQAWFTTKPTWCQTPWDSIMSRAICEARRGLMKGSNLPGAVSIKQYHSPLGNDRCAVSPYSDMFGQRERMTCCLSRCLKAL